MTSREGLGLLAKVTSPPARRFKNHVHMERFQHLRRKYQAVQDAEQLLELLICKGALPPVLRTMIMTSPFVFDTSKSSNNVQYRPSACRPVARSENFVTQEASRTRAPSLRTS